MSKILDKKIGEVEPLTKSMVSKLATLGIATLSDLFYYFPRKYEDYTDVTKIGDIGNSKSETLNSKQILNPKSQNSNKSALEPIYTIRGTLQAIANKKTRRRGFTVTEAMIEDGTGVLKVVWFNQPYLAKMLSVGSFLILSGKVNFDYFSRSLVMESPTRSAAPKIVPIYSVSAGISTFFVTKLFEKVAKLTDEIEDYLPGEFRDKFGLLTLSKSIRSIHMPKDTEALEQAQRRLAFDELFFISLRARLAKLEVEKTSAKPVVTDIGQLKDFIGKLPFTLTNDQKKAVWQVVKDLEKNTPMHRLLNGDVGSGKTIVAAIAAYLVNLAGQKTLLMAPTSILAVQHFETFKKIFEGMDVKIGLLTSDRKEMNHESGIMNQAKPQAHNSEFIIHNSDVIIGTHALLHAKESFDNVGLVVVDEQHRFGVKQRAALQELPITSFESEPEGSSLRVEDNYQLPINDQIEQSKNDKIIGNWNLELGNSQVMHPHFLSMTATPIPRTLHLALFGDLDITLIKEKPADRKEIKTKFVNAQFREQAYDFVRGQIESGRQVFVICPLIERKEQVASSEEQGELFEEERKTVMTEAEKLKKIFPEFNIGILHGKMKGSEKDEIMAEFSANRANILVSTSVVEVGVDIPNATVMLVEDAERFGLAQIHQFRGRVGRSEHQSYCFLFSNSQSEKVLSRLQSLERVADGFELAQIDLSTRGPGSIFGTDQSGIIDLKMASLSDQKLVSEASEAAEKVAAIIENYPGVKTELSKYLFSKHLE